MISNIDSLIPHRPPMQLIESVLTSDATGLWALARVTAQSPFLLSGRVSAAVGLEYLAQSAAALFTLWSDAGTAPVARQGMLIACPKLDADVPWFEMGSVLLLHVVPVSRMPTAEQGAGLVKFSGTIHVLKQGERIPEHMPLREPGVVRAELSVYI